ncbi:MAG: DUF4432 family protein [Chloroflexi bacterium]|nr:DUF4432 family protein [Chloroflexota bacterium]
MADGPAAGTRVITVQLADSWVFRVLLDRGADIGSAWFRGSPIAWTSPVGERPRFSPSVETHGWAPLAAVW